eukprot:CAMPEP_0184326760 /NCGR_PEP_ID=MMETSP1049-20130417/142732_1 /TAXON_ID=77928 /ORGANISM="Proteomonas sulcata, Strain CCMP704" /LENGTH=223 /DNA_ID=CAMNT_0026648971 /DNA_START=513 /DNA_END=1185 /DNA_ORIENTATION=-
MSGDEDKGALAERSNYYYAHSNTSSKTLVGATEIYNHKALSPEEAQKLRRHDSQGESSWNSAGTWEEKDFSKWATERLKELITEIQTPGGLQFTDVPTVDDCSCSVVFSRGKKKTILEIEKVKISWNNAHTEGKSKGKVELTDVSSSSLDDFQFAVKVDKDEGNKPQLEADLKGCKGLLQSVFKKLIEEAPQSDGRAWALVLGLQDSGSGAHHPEDLKARGLG